MMNNTLPPFYSKNSQNWDSFLRSYLSVYHRLWEFKTRKKWARTRFRVFGLKKKVLDRFFNRMDGPVKPIIMHGSAKFSPNGRSELSAPTTSIYRLCEKRFKVELVDEFRTTKICSNCNHVLNPVLICSNDRRKTKEIRGLRRCSSSECSQTWFKNRGFERGFKCSTMPFNPPIPVSISRI
jgi:hypothetical protein